MRRALSSVAITLLLLTTVLTAQQASNDQSGTWTAEVESNGRIQLNLSFERRNNFGHDFEISELTGLTSEQISSANSPVKFNLRRDAGVVNFEGVFTNGRGTGSFNFAPDAAFKQEMEANGITLEGRKQFSMAMVNATRALLKDLQSVGYQPNANELIEAAIFKVSSDKVRALQQLGYEKPTIRKMVEYQIHKVTPEYVRAMRNEFGPDISLNSMVELSIFGVQPGMRAEYDKLGITGLGAKDLVNFRIHKVTPEFIADMRKAGLTDLSAKQLEELRIFNVDAKVIENYAKVGYKDLSARQLVEFRIHNISPEFIERVKAEGYGSLSPRELVDLKITGRLRARRSML